MIFEIYISKNYGFFIVFHKEVVKTTMVKVFFLFLRYKIITFKDFLRRRFDVVKLDKVLDPETNFRILY